MRSTPFEKLRKAMEATQAERLRERVVQVIPLTIVFDNIDFGDRNLLRNVEMPVDGRIFEPKIAVGASSGDTYIDIEYNDEVIATARLSVGMNPVNAKGNVVKRGDRVALFSHGSGNAKDVSVSFVIKEL